MLGVWVVNILSCYSIFYPAIVFWVLSCQYICSWSSVRNILLPINIAFSHVAFFLLTSSWCYLQVSMCHASCIIFVWSFVQEMYDYTHIPGQAVLHRGRHRHGARAISSGLRINLLLWCRRYTGISLPPLLPLSPPLPLAPLLSPSPSLPPSLHVLFLHTRCRVNCYT